MKDQLLAVQFPHPGGEHRPDREGFKGWNLGRHQRKFMKTSGRWLTSGESNAEEEEGELIFWGEWEPPSRVLTELSQPDSRRPRYLVEPVLASPPDSPSAQNTDPFVFGDRFLYSNCRQHTKRGPLRTQQLAPGSMILFGSALRGEFVVDTVFVVGVGHHLTFENAADLNVNQAFRTATLELLFPKHQDLDFRLYESATSNDPVGGMFSFVPCLPYEDDPEGFARPAIDLEKVVNPRNRQGLKYTRMTSLNDMKDVWERVVQQVLDQALALGVQLATPSRVN